MCGHWGVFLQLPDYWRGHCVRIRPQKGPGECEPAVFVGACYRFLLPARCQAGHLRPGPGPWRAWGLCQRPQDPSTVLPVLGTHRAPAASLLAGLRDGDIHSPFLFIVVLGIEPRASCILDSTYVLSPHVADVSRGPGTRGLEHAKCSGKELNQLWQATPEV